MKDELGTRMKDFYENRSKQFLPRRTPVIIRIDGKAFHTYTKGMNKPYDEVLTHAMQQTSKFLCQNIQGCNIAFTQSDEISLLLTDWTNLKTEAWFNYNIQKITSVSASLATAHFNMIMNEGSVTLPFFIATFDSRAFSIPREEVCNYFIWRQQDAIRNSVQMLAQANFSHRELQEKNTAEIKQMLLRKNLVFEDIKPNLQRGSCVLKQLTEDGENKWMIDENPPVFTQERHYIERFALHYSIL